MSEKVLDHGFIDLQQVMGSDLSTVNSARVSFGKQVDAMSEKDEALIRYLADHQHHSPFRHAYMTFHIKAPIFVARQWVKHQVGCSWNEISGRYVEFEPEFYVPESFRTQSSSVKQGSDGEHQDPAQCSYVYKNAMTKTYNAYKELLRMGVAKEQARAVLPTALYTEWWWTASLQAVCHFLHLRLASHSQWEIREYAKVVERIVRPHFPVSIDAMLAANN